MYLNFATFKKRRPYRKANLSINSRLSLSCYKNLYQRPAAGYNTLVVHLKTIQQLLLALLFLPHSLSHKKDYIY